MWLPRIRFHKRVLIITATLISLLLVWYLLAPGDEGVRVATMKYKEFADGYEGLPSDFSTCYGTRWDDETLFIYHDVKERAADKSYLDTRAAHYRRLQRKYERAALHPWLPVLPDPW